MRRDIFFNEVTAYVAANYPDIFLEAVRDIHQHNFLNKLLADAERNKKVAERYGFDPRLFSPSSN